MSEPLLTVLRLCLLALLYLFFLRVLRAVWAEMRPPRPAMADPAVAPARRGERGLRRRARDAEPRLRIVAPPERAGQSFEVHDELTIGRATGCHVCLDDTFVSHIHARVFRRDGDHLVEDLGSTNGTYLNRRKVAGPQVLQPGDHIQIGNTVLELA